MVSMTPEQWQQAEELFYQARSRKPVERAKFLSEACSNAPRLRAELEKLLDVSVEQRTVFDPTPEMPADECGTSRAGSPENWETLDPIAARAVYARSHPAIAPQTSIAAGRYQIQRSLGIGGQKQAYLARDTHLTRDVVIALLRTEQLDADNVVRLTREAQAMARLGDHPNIVTVYDIGEEQGRPYIVSQYVEGGSVDDLLRRAGKRPLPLEHLLHIAKDVCQALAHSHSRGIIHRDLKPANVWLTRDGVAKLGDFGLAVGLDFSRVTMRGTLLGTVSYLPPELALGQEAEARSDLYSLGVMLYEMATGRLPFLGDQIVSIISQHLNTQPVAPSWHNPEMPRVLEAVILRLLQKSPEERPNSAAEVAEVLASLNASASALVERVAPQDAKSLARLAGGIFVGREMEINELRTALHEVAAGHGRLLMLVGEPGSGKTRLAEQLATYARLCEAQVLTGRCYEGEGAPVFWPWVQIVRAYAQEEKPEDLLSVMGPGAAEIAEVVAEVKERLPQLPSPPTLEPKQARFRLFDSITAFLKNAGRRRPLVLILDDLHWADKPSLLLLQFLARELREARLLVIGTYRDVELGRQHPLVQTLGELSREGLSARLTLAGLNRGDVARFIEMTAGLDPSEELVQAVYQETEGNPFFVNEVVSLLVAEGRLAHPESMTSVSLRIPQGVREVIGRRLNRLTEECNCLLTMASVIGREFSREALAPLSELSEDRLVEVLDEALQARVVVEVPRTVGRYNFVHALIRETLYAEISTNRRGRLHRRIGESLEKLHAKSLAPHFAELAHHFLQAAPDGDLEKALSYGVNAARRALDLLAYEEAASHYERVLEALQLKDEVDQAQRTELLLALGEALTKAGNVAKARETFVQAAELARQQGAAEQLAHAALGIGAGFTGATGRVDELQVSIMREALDALSEEDSALRARLLAHLSLALYYMPEDRVRLSQQAVEMARRVGDPMAIVVALYSRHAALSLSEDIKERLEVATEILRLAKAADNQEMALRAHYRRILDLMEIGDIPAVDAEIEAYARLAEELRQPRYLWQVPFLRASRALMEGRFSDCERLRQEALTIGRRAQDPLLPLFLGTQAISLRFRQGRAEDLVEPVKGYVKKFPMIPGMRATLARVYSHLDNEAEARHLFEEIAAHDFADLGRDGSWFSDLTNLSYTCHFLGDERRAGRLYELLHPYAGRCVVAGSSGVNGGPTSFILALLATTMRRWVAAITHFEEAIELNQRMKAKPFIAQSQYHYALMLLTRAEANDREKALELLDQALATAEEIGMERLAEKVRAVRSET